jgi:hypothetical protein
LTIEPNGKRRTYELSFLQSREDPDYVVVRLLLRMPDSADDRQLFQEIVAD